jgi:hypothetical protein
MMVRFKSGQQDTFPVWEDVVLIASDSIDEAFAIAEREGKRREKGGSDTMVWEGQPARFEFAGIRKLIKCEEVERRPVSGTEITYSEFVLSSLEDVRKFCRGESVSVIYTQEFLDDD